MEGYPNPDKTLESFLMTAELERSNDIISSNALLDIKWEFAFRGIIRIHFSAIFLTDRLSIYFAPSQFAHLKCRQTPCVNIETQLMYRI